MYRALLVDDEILIRERMAQKIQWERFGFELIAACENGQEAIDVLEKETIDVVLTDICMPYIDGLELSKYIFEHYRHIKIIILSGYAEFEFAKKAMQYQVHTYLLKPITSEELGQVLQELHHSLDNEKQNRQFQSITQDTYSMLRIQDLLRIAQGSLEPELIHKKLKEYAPEFYRESARYCAALLCTGKGLAKTQLEDIEQALSSFSASLLAFENLDKSIILFLRAENNMEMRGLLRDTAAYIRSYIRKHYKIDSGMMIGVDVPDCASLPLSYEKIGELKEFLYLEKEDGLYFWDDYYKINRKISLLPFENEYEKKILMAVQSNLTEEIHAIVSASITEARENWYRRPRMISVYQSILISVVNAFQRMGIEDFTVFEKAQTVLERLYQCNVITEMAKLVKEFLLHAAKIRNTNRESYGERQAVLSLEYIEQNFADCDFSMVTMCEKLAISVSYFSAAFKDYTGKTFIEVLTDRRMREAKILLQNPNLKTYEVAERCGYRDSSYFSTLFKKYFNMTPKEYTKANKK